MPIADFNKDNAFVITIRKLNLIINDNIIKITKKIIYISSILFIFSIIGTIFIRECWIVLIAALLLLIFNTIKFNDILKDSKLKDVRDLIYGNEYSIIYVNNEKIFDMIQTIKEAQGKIIILNEMLTFELFIISVLLALTTLLKIFSII